jgi:hypothetical protein
MAEDAITAAVVPLPLAEIKAADRWLAAAGTTGKKQCAVEAVALPTPDLHRLLMPLYRVPVQLIPQPLIPRPTLRLLMPRLHTLQRRMLQHLAAADNRTADMMPAGTISSR